jgi:ABC-type microcin C transport system duplicated ATPase subunit YejF
MTDQKPTNPTPGHPTATPLLSVKGLVVRFPQRSGILQRVVGWSRAVDGVSFDLARGESLGLVGESGSGKSTVARAVVRLVEAAEGTISLWGEDLRQARGVGLKRLRRRVQMIFQDPAGSLNPRMRIGDIVAEPLIVHGEAGTKHELTQRVGGLLERCGMPAACMDRFPHQFSGGQRQRIAIARALALTPELIVCDEPTSALDVSIQAQILNLLKDLQRERGLSYLFISHDMGVIQHICDRIAVMRAGKIVEMGSRDEVLETPREDYTRSLLAAVPNAG